MIQRFGMTYDVRQIFERISETLAIHHPAPVPSAPSNTNPSLDSCSARVFNATLNTIISDVVSTTESFEEARQGLERKGDGYVYSYFRDQSNYVLEVNEVVLSHIYYLHYVYLCFEKLSHGDNWGT